MSDAAREEYLQKIKAVESVDKDGGYNVEESASTGGAVSASSLSATATPSIGNANYVIPPIKKWPQKIELPSGISRADYDIHAMNYAQKNITNPDVFAPLNTAKFDVRPPKFVGEGYVRKDFEFYLEELCDIAGPKMGLQKLFICSSFRTLEHQAWLYRNKSKKVLTGPHTGGLAVDIGATGKNRYILADTAFYMGFGGIFVGEDFVHIDIAPKGYYAYPPVPTYYSPDKKYG
jgi:uncharacterized protein YcbK (DUF882 family)